MICSKEKCTACEACTSVCPQSAISMKNDKYGNIYPNIDERMCVNCNLCKKACPQLKSELGFKMPITAYAMYNKDYNERSKSTSGGLASIFYQKILSENGVVYGTSNLFGDRKNLKFIRIADEKDLYKVKGSKYTHCYIQKIFIDVKKDLLDNKKVLFIGTPCQISGLKSYLMKEYENLITIDIICHGVPSQQLLFEQIDALKIPIDKIKWLSFRKNSNNHNFSFKLMDFNGNSIYEKEAEDIPYYKNFLEGNFYRENCYSCRYAQIQRISDITIGDFWGLDRNSMVYDDENKGISLVMPITDRGLNLVKSILNKCEFEERTIEEARKENGQLNYPIKKGKKYEIYINDYPKYGFEKTMNNMLTFKEKIKLIVKNTFLYNVYKKIDNSKL